MSSGDSFSSSSNGPETPPLSHDKYHHEQHSRHQYDSRVSGIMHPPSIALSPAIKDEPEG